MRALLWSFAYFFCLLASYYILRPIRDAAGLAGGVKNLPWLFTGTMLVMLLVNPPFAALVSNLPRRRFIPLTYRFFAVNLLIFFALYKLLPETQQVWVGRAFYIWTAVFNLFVVSIFWGFMADAFHSGQGKRLFGFIGVGGTIGGIVGSAITDAAGIAAPEGSVTVPWSVAVEDCANMAVAARQIIIVVFIFSSRTSTGKTIASAR